MTRVKLAGSFAAVVGGACLLYHCGYGDGHSPAGPSPAKGPSTQNTQSVEVAAAGAEDEGDVEPLPEEQAESAAVSEPPPDDEDLSDEAAAARQEAFFQRGVAAFESEPLDNAWATQTATAIESALTARGVRQRFPGVTFEPVECRTTICSLMMHIGPGVDILRLKASMRRVVVNLLSRGIRFGWAFSMTPDPSGQGTLARYHFSFVR